MNFAVDFTTIIYILAKTIHKCQANFQSFFIFFEKFFLLAIFSASKRICSLVFVHSTLKNTTTVTMYGHHGAKKHTH